MRRLSQYWELGGADRRLTGWPTIFEDQLDGWWRDRTMWPTPRSLGTFTRWFDCKSHSMLFDLRDEPLIERRSKCLPGRVDRVIGHYALDVD